MSVMIETHDLRRTFRTRGKGEAVEAVRGVDLRVDAGAIFGFLGPNGAGKTTTLRMLATLLPPTSGTATVAGADLARQPQEVPGRIGYVPQGGSTDPAETGAVTICFPQDVQAEAFDWPVELFAKRVWHVARPLPETAVIERAAEIIRAAERPLIVAGGGVHYSQATEALQAFCEATGIPVGQTQAGKGTLAYDHPQCLGAIGSTGTTAANAIAHDADVVIGIGTSWPIFRLVFLPSAARSFGDAMILTLDSVCRKRAKMVEGMLTTKSERFAGLNVHMAASFSSTLRIRPTDWARTRAASACA